MHDMQTIPTDGTIIVHDSTTSITTNQDSKTQYLANGDSYTFYIDKVADDNYDWELYPSPRDGWHNPRRIDARKLPTLNKNMHCRTRHALPIKRREINN